MATLNTYMMKTRVVQTLNGHGWNMLIMDHVQGHGYFDGTLTTMVKSLGIHVWAWNYAQRLPTWTCGTLFLNEAPWVQQAQNHYEFPKLAWRHNERLNMYKMVIHIQVVGVVFVSVCGGVVCFNQLKDMIEIICDLNYSEREKKQLPCCRSRVDSDVEIVGWRSSRSMQWGFSLQWTVELMLQVWR